MYKNPIIERDEKIAYLEKEQLQLRRELPALRESLTKANKNLEAAQKNNIQKMNRYKQAALITEQKVAESIHTDSKSLNSNPHLIPLLALFQDRDDFEVDIANEAVKPVKEDLFLKYVAEDIEKSTRHKDISTSEVELYKERLVEVKQQVLEKVKARWMRPGRRDSICSQASSKRDREDDDENDMEKRNVKAVPCPPIK